MRRDDALLTDEFAYEFSGSWNNHPTMYVHFHPFYEIYYLIEGRISYLIEDEKFDIPAGHFICIPPNTAHKTLRFPSVDRKRMVLYLSKKEMDAFFSAIPNLAKCFEDKIVRIGDHRKYIDDAIHLLIEEENGQSNPAMVKSLFTQILVMLSRENINWQITDMHAQNNGVLEKQMSKISKYIDAHYAEDISLEHLSRIFYLNPSYISRSFKAVHGITLIEYRNKVRLQRARNLLTTTTLSLPDIAMQCGFGTANGFSATFKAHTGFSPGAYRKKIINSKGESHF